jgi:P-type Ca2+ transporter type 2C
MNSFAFKKTEEIFEQFNSSKQGLNTDQVLKNKNEFGLNIVKNVKRRTYVGIFFSQFNNVFSYVLLSASLIVLFLGDHIDFFVILSVLILNAVIGLFQEGKAQRVFEVLQKTVKSEAIVIRDGVQKKIIDEEVVAGDIIFLKDGDKVPADAKLIESNNLKVNESSLTGESSTVLKEVVSLHDENIQISDQKNMVFKGTYVVSGLAKAIVVGVGVNTEIGKVAKQIDELDSELPIKASIRNLSKIILVTVLVSSIIIYIFGIGYGMAAKEIFLIVVALSVSAIPEGLPVILTVVLALGFHRMSKKNVLVKRLQAVDALGQTNIVALDKTGTITKNQMKVEKVFVDNNFYYVSGDGYEPKGKIFFGESEFDFNSSDSLLLLSKICASTSIGGFSFNEHEKVWEGNFGDPTEISLLVFAEKLGINKDELFKKNPLQREIPFDFHYKHHSTINEIDGVNHLFVSGAPEVILQSSSLILINGEELKFDEAQHENIKHSISKMTKDGYRILCMAYQKNPDLNLDPHSLENLVFVGFVGINDTIRKTVEGSMKALEEAGIRAIMITGDHKETAIGIASKIGIFKKDSLALTGKEMSEMNDFVLKDKLEKVAVFARVTPEQKLRIISLFKQRGETIAMTGDGVNDVLSLVKADLGVSMGYGATDVAKEAADIILLDNNFGSLSVGVLEGRNIYTNIRKTTEYLLSTSLAEIAVIFFCVALGLPLALTAVQILWLNLVTGSIMAIGFAFESSDTRLLTQKNWKPTKFLLTKKSLLKIFILAFTMASLAIVLFFRGLNVDLVYAQSVALMILIILELYNIYNIKADDKSIFKTNIFNNKVFLFGGFISILLALFAMYNPFMQIALGLKPISFVDWIYVISFGFILILIEEIRKLFSKRVSNFS